MGLQNLSWELIFFAIVLILSPAAQDKFPCAQMGARSVLCLVPPAPEGRSWDLGRHCTASVPGWELASVLGAQSGTCRSLHLDHKAFHASSPWAQSWEWVIISGFYIFVLVYGKICLSLLWVAGNENVASRGCSLGLGFHGVWLWLLFLVRVSFLRFWSSFFPQWGSLRLSGIIFHVLSSF